MDVLVTGGAVIAAATGSAWLTAWATRKGRISEFRQKWINELRADVAAFLGAVRRYRDARGSEPGEAARYEADQIYNRIELRINPRQNSNKEEDDKFLKVLEALLKKPPKGASQEAG